MTTSLRTSPRTSSPRTSFPRSVVFFFAKFSLSLLHWQRADAALVAFFTDAACTTAALSTAQAFTDACLPVPLQQQAVYLTNCSATTLIGSLFPAFSMSVVPPCTGAASSFTATATCAPVAGTTVYVKATDFTCTSNGLAYAMALDPATTSCSSVPATQVRYLPLVAKGASYCIPASGTNANRFDMTATPGSIVGTLTIAVFSSTTGACTSQTATFTNIVALGACTAADGSASNGVTKSMQIWPAPSIMCAMRSMAGYDVIGPQLSQTFETTESACAMRCCTTALCLGYSFAKGSLGTPVLVPQSSVASTSVSSPFNDPWTNEIRDGSSFFTQCQNLQNGACVRKVISAGQVPPVMATIAQALCMLLSNATALVPSNMMTGAVMPSVVTS